ncbi:Ubiquitin-like protein [Savitreella phatthalungensis]
MTWSATVAAYLDAGGEATAREVTIRFRPIARAPILRQQIYKLHSGASFGEAVDLLRNLLKRGEPESIFCYVDMSFIPATDESLGNLWRCYESDDTLNLSYSLAPAFG